MPITKLVKKLLCATPTSGTNSPKKWVTGSICKTHILPIRPNTWRRFGGCWHSFTIKVCCTRATPFNRIPLKRVPDFLLMSSTSLVATKMSKTPLLWLCLRCWKVKVCHLMLSSAKKHTYSPGPPPLGHFPPIPHSPWALKLSTHSLQPTINIHLSPCKWCLPKIWFPTNSLKGLRSFKMLLIWQITRRAPNKYLMLF